MKKLVLLKSTCKIIRFLFWNDIPLKVRCTVNKTRLIRIPRDLPFLFAISVIRTMHITNFNEFVGKLRTIRVDKEIER